MDLVSWMPDAPCHPVAEWLRSLPEGTTPQQAWNQCPQADWLLWLYARRNADPVVAVRIALDIARTVRHLNTDPRVGACLATVERWLVDPASVSRPDLGASAADAEDAAGAADAAGGAGDAAAAAARAAMWVADAAWAAVWAENEARAAWVARAAGAAERAAMWAAGAAGVGAAARVAGYADIVRKHIPVVPV